MGAQEGSLQTACARLRQGGVISGLPDRPRNINKKQVIGYGAELAFYQICGGSRTDNRFTSRSRSRFVSQPVHVSLPQGISRTAVSNNRLNGAALKVSRRSANQVNREQRDYSDLGRRFHRPFAEGTVDVHDIRSPAYFVRFSGGETQPKGNYMMRLQDVEGLTPAQIRDRFAVPTVNTMEQMHIIEVSFGAQMLSGAVNRHPQWGSGGGKQYLLNGSADEHINQVIDIRNW